MGKASGKVNTGLSVRSRQKIELINAFQSAKSVDKMLKSFEKMEKLFDESDLGMYCWTLATKLRNQGRSFEQVLSFGNRGLRIFIDNDSKNIPCFGKSCPIVLTCTGKDGSLCFHYHNSSLYIACVCNLLADACYELKRYNESLSYFNWSNRNLCKLENDGHSSCPNYCLLNALLTNQMGMYILKTKMGRVDEAVIPLRKVLEIEESMLEEGCIQLGNTNEEVSCTYLSLMNYEEALPFCLKALEIYTKHLGRNSAEVARMMRLLALIYLEFKEYEKALEQNQLSHNILKSMTPNSPEFIYAEIDHGDILIGLGKYEEAIHVLKSVVLHTKGIIQGIAFITMAKAFCWSEKFADANKYMRTAQRILEKIEDQPIDVAIGFRDMSRLCEKMNDFENAISLLRRSLTIPQIPMKLLAEGSARLFSLLSISGKEDERIAFMEDVVEKLKEKFGAEHCEVGHGYKNLGATYLKSGQEELAVKFMVKAKDIMDITLGPHHLDSLKTSQSLAETYATFKRYNQAIEIQGNIVEGLKGMVPSEQIFLDEAVVCLNKMKEMESIEVAESPQSRDGEDLSATNSKVAFQNMKGNYL